MIVHTAPPSGKGVGRVQEAGKRAAETNLSQALSLAMLALSALAAGRGGDPAPEGPEGLTWQVCFFDLVALSP